MSDKEEEEESSDEREYNSNYIAHPAIYEGRFGDSSEDSSSIEESENSSSSEDSEVSSYDESSNQDFISLDDKILQQENVKKNEENNKLKLINANLVVIIKALINKKLENDGLGSKKFNELKDKILSLEMNLKDSNDRLSILKQEIE